jgi:hypothetical protein
MEIYPNIAERLNDLDIGVLGMQLAKICQSAKKCILPYLQSISLGLDMSILNFSMNVQLR